MVMVLSVRTDRDVVRLGIIRRRVVHHTLGHVEDIAGGHRKVLTVEGVPAT